MPGAIGHIALMKDSSEIGAVDGLAGEAAERCLAGKGEAQCAIGAVEVTNLKIHVGQSVERHHTILFSDERSVRKVVGKQPRLVVIVLR